MKIIEIKATPKQLKQLKPIKNKILKSTGGVLAQVYLTNNTCNYKYGTMRFLYIAPECIANIKNAICKEVAITEKKEKYMDEVLEK